MGELILNGKSYGGRALYRELTQAEYNALPLTKLTDGVMYCISDAGGASDAYPPIIYSDEEREVGVWIDGKPLYQKTYKIGSMIKDSSWHSVSHNIANIDNIVNSFGMLWDTASSGVRYPINVYRPGNTYGVVVQCNRTNFSYINNWLDNVADSYITIQYTKTTDVAGSGKWSTQGTPTHHYSTNEHVIGTWVDGKPLYEKSFFDVTLSRGQSTQISHGIQSIGTKVSINGIVVRDSDGWSTSLEHYEDSSTYIRSTFTDTNVVIRVNISSGDYKANFTLQYTKTTD